MVLDLLGRLRKSDSRAGSGAQMGEVCPAVGHPRGGRCTSFLTCILSPGFGESWGWGQALSQPAHLDPTPIPGSPTACGKPTSSLSGSWAPNPNPTIKTSSCPRTHENPLYYPSEGGKLWITQNQKPDSVEKTSQSSEPLAIAGPQPDPSESHAPGAYLFKVTHMDVQMH